MGITELHEKLAVSEDSPAARSKGEWGRGEVASCPSSPT